MLIICDDQIYQKEILVRKKVLKKSRVLVACINIEGIPVEWNIADKNYVYAQIKYPII